MFYTSFYPTKYFYKDELLVKNEISVLSDGRGYLFIGYCNSDKLKYNIALSQNTVENNNFCRSKIPIWRNMLSKKEILYRNNDNKIYNPFSYQMRDYWVGSIMSILFFPSLAYYLYIRNKENKIK
jgi:hypothetical protein